MVGKRIGCGKSLGTCCSAVGCSMRTGTNLLSKIKMYPFPKTQERLNAWIVAVKRKDWKPTRGSQICSRHFITGKPSLMRDHPDWVPSVFLDGYRADPSRNLGYYERFERRQQSMKQRIESNLYPSSALFEDIDTNDDSHAESCHASTQTDIIMADLSNQNEEIVRLKKIVAAFNLQTSLLLAAAKKSTFMKKT